jgi:hypothetical protein
MVLLAGFGSSAGWSQSTSAINGLVYADYYYVLGSGDPELQGQNAFNIRRVFFTFENNLTANLKFRFRLESEGHDYGSTSKIDPFVKQAFLEWSNLIPKHKVYLGIAETNANNNSEEYWGYRSIEKNILELNKICSAADFGIGVKGDFGTLVHHWLTVMNGTGYGAAEGDRYKKIGYSFWITPLPRLTLEAYADYEKQNASDPQTVSELNSAKDYRLATSYGTMKGFAGYSMPNLTFGCEAFLRINQQSGITGVTVSPDNQGKKFRIAQSSLADVRKMGLSAYAAWTTPVSNLKVFGRYDYFDPNIRWNVYTDFDSGDGLLKGGSNDETVTVFAGLDYLASGEIHVMPNVIFKQYAKAGLKDDVTVRMTLYFKFDSGRIATQ